MAAPPRATNTAATPRILDRLLAERKITREQHEDILVTMRRMRLEVEDAIAEHLHLPEADALKLLAGVYRTRFVSTEKLAKAVVDRSVLDLVPRKVVDRYEVVPLLFDPTSATLSVVLADPDNVQALEEVKVISRARAVVGLVARALAVRALIAKIYNGDPSQFAKLERERADVAWAMGSNDVFERGQGGGMASAEGAMNINQAQRQMGRGVPQLGLDPAPAVQGPPQGYNPHAVPDLGVRPVAPQVPPQKIPSLAPPAGNVPAPPPPTPVAAPVATPAFPIPALALQPVAPPRPATEPPPAGVPFEHWLESLNVLVSLLENNRPDLRGHSAHVARLTRKLCERLGLSDQDSHEIVAAAFLHDLGKASSYHLTTLNVAEYEGHKVAARKSYLTPGRLMAGVKLPRATLEALNHMYERFDGKGFPDGQSGKDIPLGARVLAITDTYADLTQNPRNPFRKSLRPLEASDVLSKFKGTVFDVNLVDIFRHVVTGDDLKAKLLANRRSALIVDPDPEETTVLELRMIEQGFEVKIARTSDQALAMLAAAAPDGGLGVELVISEVELQPIDGFQLLERARQTEGGKTAVWVFLSARADRDAINKGFEAGAADYVEKPAKAEILVAKLRKLLEQGAPAKAAITRGVSGSLEEMALPDMVQILAQGRKTGALKIRANEGTGELHFVQGDIWNAVFGKKKGEDAVYAMLRLRSGDFALDPNFKSDERVIQISAEGLLLEGMRRMDEDGRP
ncbi:MAG: DUF4388 domain-containing protein [Myxococcales bacterium]|nr:DUF4388 domain-containing protein [Myxococcales bacterium]